MVFNKRVSYNVATRSATTSMTLSRMVTKYHGEYKCAFGSNSSGTGLYISMVPRDRKCTIMITSDRSISVSSVMRARNKFYYTIK